MRRVVRCFFSPEPYSLTPNRQIYALPGDKYSKGCKHIFFENLINMHVSERNKTKLKKKKNWVLGFNNKSKPQITTINLTQYVF